MTFRVFLLEKSGELSKLKAALQPALDMATAFENYNGRLFALDIAPKNINKECIIRLLEDGERAQYWKFENGTGDTPRLQLSSADNEPNWEQGQQVHIVFFIAEEDADWSGGGTERLWATAEGLYFRLDNTPWYIRGIANRDLVDATPIDPRDLSILEYRLLVDIGGHSTYWIQLKTYPTKPPYTTIEQSYLERIIGAGASYEGTGDGFFSLDVKPEQDREPLKTLLREGENDGIWLWEVACEHDTSQ